MNKKICFSIDIEPDYGGLLSDDKYEGLKDLPKLLEIVKKNELKITCFVTGKTFEDNDGLIDILKEMNAEIEQHSFSHKIDNKNWKKDIQKGFDTHVKIVGEKPIGYRAPQGIIFEEQIDFLESLGYQYDSSIFPTYFPGRFNRKHFPQKAFKIIDKKIIEIPFTVIPKIRIPFGLSYLQLFGLNSFKLFSKIFGMNEKMIFDFHSYELGKNKSYRNLPVFSKIGYFRSQKTYKDPFTVFELFVKYINENGYKSIFMKDALNEAKQNDFSWRWREN
jgi:hypothetical protein